MLEPGSRVDAFAPKVERYRLHLDVEPESGQFSGRVEIVLHDLRGDFTLDARELDIRDAWFDSSPVSVAVDDQLGTVRISPGGRESGILRMKFSGRAADQALVGLYRCRQGPHTILTSQCQPGGARRIFPCLDRPDRKAVLELEVTTPPGVEVIANTPLLSEAREGGRVVRRFAPTPPMATYLFYLGVGQFEWLRDDGAAPRIAVACPPGRGREGAFGLAQARPILKGFEEYFRIRYPLPKLDLVSVSEHAWSAMENWGAITFREMRLLADEHASARQRRDIVATIAHEVAHQWFGNLVTIGEWTDIWLNESFASLMELVMVDQLDPGSRMVDDFLLTWTGPARLGDSLSSTHPVVSRVERPEEIGQAFDEISYGKGASVLRMVEAFLGPAQFQRGVTAYLDRFSYRNAASADLWRALEEVSGQPVGRLLGAWVDRPGLPVVRVRRAGDGIELRQERFSLDGKHVPGTWPIPLASSALGPARLWEGPYLEIHGTLPTDLTSEGRGFFRVHLDDGLYDELLDRVLSMGSAERWAVLDDLVAFTLSGDSPPKRLFDFVDRVRAATDYLTVQAVAGELSQLAAYVGNAGPFAAATRTFLSSQWTRLGESTSVGGAEVASALRERVANAWLLLDEGFARSLASGFDSFETVPAELRGPVAAAMGRTGGPRNRERLLGALASDPGEALGLQIEYGLVSSRDPAEVAASLELLSDGTLNRGHAAQIVRRAALPPEGRTATWTWIQANVESFDRTHPGLDFAGYVLQHAVPLVGIGRRAEVREFVERTALPLAARGASKGLAHLEVIDRFVEREGRRLSS